MLEKILRIEKSNWKESPDSWESYDGYQIITDQQTIKIGVSDGQSCCESFDCLTSNDNLDEFVGAEIAEIVRVSECLNTKVLPEYGYDEGDAMFININTNIGTLQFVVYNCHNGYYGHEGIVVSRQLNLSENL